MTSNLNMKMNTSNLLVFTIINYNYLIFLEDKTYEKFHPRFSIGKNSLEIIERSKNIHFYY